MRTSKTARVLLLALGIGLIGCGCGGEEQDESNRPAVRWTESKLNPLVGSLRAAVVDRPGPDRAWVEVQWDGRHHTEDCAVSIALPEGAILLEGDPERPLGVDEAVGVHRWLVEYPLGRPLDAVLRYCVPTADGMRSSEVAVRLTE